MTFIWSTSFPNFIGGSKDIRFTIGHQYQHNRVNPYDYDSAINNSYGKTFLGSSQKSIDLN